MALVTTVAIIEDDDELRELTRQFLCAEGFHAVGVASAEELSEVAVLPSLYIVDLNLPGTDGYTLIRRLREVCPTAGVVVFSARDRTVDVTRGYEVGADIYLTKPVDPTIMLAALKRLEQKRVGTAPPPLRCLASAAGGELVNGEVSVRLSYAEVCLLNALSLAGPAGMERWEIAELLGLEPDAASSNVLEARISRLRRKIQRAGPSGPVIQARRGEGYRVSTPIEFEFR